MLSQSVCAHTYCVQQAYGVDWHLSNYSPPGLSPTESRAAWNRWPEYSQVPQVVVTMEFVSL
jgi:hypothetical protein